VKLSASLMTPITFQILLERLRSMLYLIDYLQKKEVDNDQQLFSTRGWEMQSRKSSMLCAIIADQR
jgi:hypothetical protein